MGDSFSYYLRDIDNENLFERLDGIGELSTYMNVVPFDGWLNYVYATGDEVLLVKYDLLPGKLRTQKWFAQTENPIDEPPVLHYCLSNERKLKSPIHNLLRAKDYFVNEICEKESRQMNVHLLLICNYSFYNYDDRCSYWERLGLIVVPNFDVESKVPEHKKNEVDLFDFDFDFDVETFIKNFVVGFKKKYNIKVNKEHKTFYAQTYEDKYIDAGPEGELGDYSSYTEALRFVNFVLLRKSHDDTVADLGEPQTIFNHSGLELIQLYFFADNCLEKELQLNFVVTLYDETGRQIDIHEVEPFYYEEKGQQRLQVAYTFGEGCYKWERGRYLIELIYGNEVLVSAPFHIAGRDICGGYDKRSIQPAISGSRKIEANEVNDPRERLEQMVGLDSVKAQIKQYESSILFAQKRDKMGLSTIYPPLHSMFMGNPGTGKTTVARLLGAILKEIGVLSKGHVVFEERSTLMGQNYASEQERTLDAIERAKGGILFIDEAYLLYKPEDKRDPGINVLETLLSALADESKKDWMLLLAGYTEPMKRLLTCNPGLESRIPVQNRYLFKDYSIDDLLLIAERFCKNNDFVLSKPAYKALKEKVQYDYERRDETFGNGRYIMNIITTEIIPAMSSRVNRIYKPTRRELMVIEKSDIPKLEKDDVETYFDEHAIKRILKKLDALVGLQQVKKAIHDFVNVSRYLYKYERTQFFAEPMRWAFTGNSGTGKSTVAKIIAELLKAMNVLNRGHLVEVKAETLYQVPEYKVDDLLQSAIKRSSDGLLFVDGDAPQFKNPESNFNGDTLRLKLNSMVGNGYNGCALIIAEHSSQYQPLTKVLLENGVPSFNHTLHFSDYSDAELLQILESCLKKRRLRLSRAAREHIGRYISNLCRQSKLGYANARTMKLISKSIASNYLLRMCEGTEGASRIVTYEDVKPFVWKDSALSRIGFK